MCVQNRIREFFKWWVTPRRRTRVDERAPDKPLRAIPATVGVVAFEWIYFYLYLPFDLVAGKLGFWLSFTFWAIPPAIVAWVYRTAPARRSDWAIGRLFIGIGILAIVLSLFSEGAGVLGSLAQSLVPGFVAGAIVSTDVVLLWKMHKGSLAK